MINNDFETFLSSIQDLSFNERKGAIMRFFTTYAKPLSESQILSLAESFLKPTHNKSYTLINYLIYYIMPMLKILQNKNTIEKNIEVEEALNYDVVTDGDVYSTDTGLLLDIKADEMAPIVDDMEFLKAIGKTNPYEQ